MNIFFTAPHSAKTKLQDAYDEIIRILKKSKHQIISLELQKYDNLLDKKTTSKLTKDEKHYLYTKKGINKAQAIIIETTVQKFQIGHEATLALLYNKPVLCLSKEKDYSTQIKHPKFYAKRYKKNEDLEKIILDFINTVKKKHISVRFNSYLSADEKNFLDWYSKKQGKTISEVIRDLVKEKKNEIPGYQDDLTRLLA